MNWNPWAATCRRQVKLHRITKDDRFLVNCIRNLDESGKHTKICDNILLCIVYCYNPIYHVIITGFPCVSSFCLFVGYCKFFILPVTFPLDVNNSTECTMFTLFQSFFAEIEDFIINLKYTIFYVLNVSLIANRLKMWWQKVRTNITAFNFRVNYFTSAER